MVLLRRGKEVPKPWFFPSPEEYRRLLESEGFTIRLLARLPRPTLLPTGVEAWLETFAQPFTAAFAPDERRGTWPQCSERRCVIRKGAGGPIMCACGYMP